MGLPLRDSTSFMHPTSPGGPSLGGPSTTSDSESDPDLSEPLLSYCHTGGRRANRPSRFQHLATLHYNSKGALDLSPRFRSLVNHDDDNTTNNNNNNSTTPTRQHIHRHQTNQRRRLHRHRIRQAQQSFQKPRGSWVADAAEGYTIARSSIQLPGEDNTTNSNIGRGGGRSINRSRSSGHGSSSNSSNNSSGAGRRPPSLERQDAFRDEKTTKRRRRGRQQQRGWEVEEEQEQGHDNNNNNNNLRDEQAEVAELYRLGLLYDDEQERGAGFSLGAIVRDEPAYSLRMRPTKRSRRTEGKGNGGHSGGVSLSVVDLAFSAFGADEALAEWMLSGSGSSSGSALSGAPAREEHRPWMEIAHDTPRLTVVYELADDAVSAMSVDDDLLDSVSVSEISFCGGEEDERAWAMLDENAMSATMDLVEADEEVDPWVVLGQDGS